MRRNLNIVQIYLCMCVYFFKHLLTSISFDIRKRIDSIKRKYFFLFLFCFGFFLFHDTKLCFILSKKGFISLCNFKAQLFASKWQKCAKKKRLFLNFLSIIFVRNGRKKDFWWHEIDLKLFFFSFLIEFVFVYFYKHAYEWEKWSKTVYILNLHICDYSVANLTHYNWQYQILLAHIILVIRFSVSFGALGYPTAYT